MHMQACTHAHTQTFALFATVSLSKNTLAYVKPLLAASFLTHRDAEQR